MSLTGDISHPAKWAAWPPHLYRIARRRFQAEAWRRQMRRFAELDPRFARDIGLTADELAQGRPRDAARRFPPA